MYGPGGLGTYMCSAKTQIVQEQVKTLQALGMLQ